MNFTEFVLIIGWSAFIILAYVYLYYAVCAASNTKNHKLISFLTPFWSITPDMFTPEGNAYRRKALITALLMGLCMFIIFAILKLEEGDHFEKSPVTIPHKARGPH